MATFVRTQTIDHPIGASGRLDLEVTSADVQVRAIEGAEAHVRGTFEIRAASDEEADRVFEAVQLQVERSGGSLSVSERRDRSGLASALGRLFGGDQADLSVAVELPAGAELRLATVSGDIQAEGLSGEQRYNTVSGDLYLTELGGSVRVKAVSGDATLRADGPFELRAEAVSGDLSVAAPLLRALRATTVSGDIDIEGELSSGGEFRAETVSGDLSVGLLGSATFHVRGVSTDVSSDIDHRLEGRLDRRRVIIGSGGPDFQFSSMSGDLMIRRARRVERGSFDEAPPVSRPSARDQLSVLEALERGEIDVDEAARRLAGGAPDA